VTEQPGWESPSGAPGEPPEPPRPPLSPEWAAEQPPPQGWSDPGYGQQPAAQQPAAQQSAAPDQQQGWGHDQAPGAGQQWGWGHDQAPGAGQQSRWGHDQAPGAGQQSGWGPPQQAAWQPPKPGVIPLRPLGVGEILDGAISTIRAKPRLMLGLSAFVAVVTQLVTVPISWVLLHDAGDRAFSFGQSTDSTSAAQDVTLTVSSLIASATQTCVTLVATLLLTGILTVVLSRAVLGQDIDAKQAWEQARPRLLPLFGVTVLVFLIVAGAGIVLIGPGVVLAVAGASDVAVGFALVIGILAFFCVALYLYVAFALAPAIVVLEKQPVVASLRRSRRLVKGAWWRTFGILLLVNIIAGIVGNIFAGIFLFAAYIAGGAGTGFQNFNPYGFAPLIISGVGAVIGAAITWPFTAVASALIYIDRRMRREGLDLELVRAAGYVPPGQSPTPGAPSDSGSYGAGPPPGAPPPPYDA
jgi:hypothetical protein